MSVFTPLLRRPLSTSSTLTRSLLTPVRAFSCTPTPRIAKVTLIGNIAADAERVPTSSGQDMIKYSVASQAGTRDNPRTNFFNVVAFEDNEPRRDFLAGLTKGCLVHVEGVLNKNTYSDRDGVQRTSIGIYHRNINVLRRSKNSGQDDSAEGLSSV